MLNIALKMILGDKAKSLGVMLGIIFTTILITLQGGIFFGFVARSHRITTDLRNADIWVMDPETESVEKTRPISESWIERVKGVPGVAAAAPLLRNVIPLKLENGEYHISEIYGIDNEVTQGAPLHLVEGYLSDLHKQGSVIIDQYAAQNNLARHNPDGSLTPLKIGDHFELGDKKATVVGFAEMTLGFLRQPILVTSYDNFKNFFNIHNKTHFILVNTLKDAKIESVIERIKQATGLVAFSTEDFEARIIKDFYVSGILINFGVSVLSGLILGVSISGQMFYIITLDNLPYYALFKAIGISNSTILKMVLVQVLTIGGIGYCIGIGCTAMLGYLIKGSSLSFLFPWELMLFSSVLIVLICIISGFISLSQVLKLDPVTVLHK
jgi:putative ABC transport system permease protein